MNDLLLSWHKLTQEQRYGSVPFLVQLDKETASKKENTPMSLNTPLRRVLHGSPLHRTGGKIALAAILIGLFAFAFPTFVRYYTAQPLQFLGALPFGFLIYLPTILVLYWLDRREREPALLYWGVVFALILFFCMVSSRTTYFLIDHLQVPFFVVVGPSEELWKVAPLLLLVIFARPAVNGTRDGFI